MSRLYLFLKILISFFERKNLFWEKSRIRTLLFFITALGIFAFPGLFPKTFRWHLTDGFNSGESKYESGGEKVVLPISGEGRVLDFRTVFSFEAEKVEESVLLTSTELYNPLKILINKDHDLVLSSASRLPHESGVTIIKKVQPNTQYEISLSFSDGKVLEVFQKPVPSNVRENPLVYRDGNFDFNFHNPVLGASGDGSKKFQGKIFLSHLNGQFYSQTRIWKALQILRLLGFLLTCYLIVWFLCHCHLNSGYQNARERIHFLTGTISIGFMISAVYHFVQGYYFGVPYPGNSFLFLPGIQFTDFIGVEGGIAKLHPYEGVGSYPPLAFLAAYPFTLIKSIYWEVFFISFVFILSMVIIGYHILKQHLSRVEAFQSSAVIFGMSYPILFCMDRGNLDQLVFPFLFWGLYIFQKTDMQRGFAFVSIAAAQKISPAIFFFLPFVKRKYVGIFKSLFLIFSLNFLSAMLFETGVLGSFQKMFQNISTLYSSWSLTDFSIYSTHSLRGMMRVIQYNFFGDWYQEGVKGWHFYYKAFSVLIFLVTLLVIYIRPQMEVWKQITLLAITTLVLPMFSPDYKLVVLMIPMIFFLASGKKEPKAFALLVLFAILCIPFEYFRVDFVSWPHFNLYQIGVGTVVRPIALSSLWGLIAFSEVKIFLAHNEPNEA